jgi:hypothetical protein
MSRLPFALGKCLPCSSPMSDGATSVIRDTGVPAVETSGHSRRQPSGNVTNF